MVQVANGPQISGCFWHSLTSIHKAPLGSKPWRHLHVRSVPHWALLVQSKSDLQPIQLRKKENIKYWNRNRKSWKSFLKSGLLFLRKKKDSKRFVCIFLTCLSPNLYRTYKLYKLEKFLWFWNKYYKMESTIYKMLDYLDKKERGSR